MSKGNLFIVTGPSGAGKGTVLGRLLPSMEQLQYSVSATTRAPREGEEDGVNYYFLNRNDFLNMVDRGEFLEYAEYVGNFYGTPAGPVDECPLSFENPTAPLIVGTVDEFVEYFLENHPEARVDYVHDEAAVRAFSAKEGAVGLLLPPLEKGDLFRGVVLGGVLPRKTFSMGHAEEKRYYLECRRIAE